MAYYKSINELELEEARREQNRIIRELEEENKKLQEKVTTYSEEYGKLREENQKLKAKLEEYENLPF